MLNEDLKNNRYKNCHCEEERSRRSRNRKGRKAKKLTKGKFEKHRVLFLIIGLVLPLKEARVL